MSTHLKALEKAVTAGGSRLTDAHAPLIELCRTLARQMDVTREPTASLTASYLSALKDLGRVLASVSPRRLPASNSVARLRADHAGRAS